MKGNLYLIPSPIGNLKEVSQRIIETINSIDYIACEDTRNTCKLLHLLNLDKKCISCHEHNEKEVSIKIIDDLLKGKNIGYLSDAGYPAISDPGCLLVKEAIKHNVKIIPLSGPSAFLNALVSSGLDTTHFYFYGFLQSKESNRINEIKKLSKFEDTIIFYESPHRVSKTLKNLYDILGDRNIVIARELTKIHEEFIRTTLKEITELKPEIIGEIVIIIDGYKEKNNKDIDENYIIDLIKILKAKNLSNRDISISISTILKINKNNVNKILNSLE
ncbi:MAG: 16S rRNA (cytidine(1402)-2'-O)-methyltransferase [Bacillales bacterium]